MTLLSLTCNNSDFKTLTFNKDLSIVVGKQLTKEQKDTLNGIGKTLSLDMIHYMLNANIKQQNLKDFLQSYGTFTMAFSHNNKNFVVEKNFKDTTFILNDKKYNTKQFKKELDNIFNPSINSENFSFRQIFNCFARRYGRYETLLQQDMGKDDYGQRLVNLFLLGIDIELVQQNYALKDGLTKLKNAQKELKKFEIDNKNIKNIKDIDDEIQKIQTNLDNFIVAKNYDELKEEADSLTQTLNEIRNKIYETQRLKSIKVSNLNSSENINIDLEEIQKIYDESKFFFNEKIIKRLDEAQDFHNQLIKNRKNRLTKEIVQIEQELQQLELQKDNIGSRRDNILKNLKNCGALEERDSLKDIILSLEKEKKDLQVYTDALKKFEKDQIDINLKLAEIKKIGLEYIEKNKKYLDKIENDFRNIVKQFYNNNGGSLKISTTKNAQNLFNIDVEIPRDGSQSVGLVKTFCYDMLLYRLNSNMLNFMAHDGCIFSEMDKRQKATIFKIILDEVKNGNLQYFINIGDTSFSEVLNDDTGILSDEDKEFIKSKVILQINEEQSTWLFGQKFD